MVRRPWCICTKPPPGTMLNYEHPLAKGLLAFFPFSEGSGLQMNDVGPATLPGNLRGSVWAANGTGTVVRNSAVPGTEPRLTVSTDILNLVSTITLAVLVRGLDTLSTGFVVDISTSAFIGKAAIYRSGTTNNAVYRTYWSGGHVDMTGVLNALDGSPHMLVLTNDGATLSGYVDGRLDASTANANAFLNDPGMILSLGDRPAGDLPGAFETSLVAVWNYALPAGMVRAFTAAPFDMFLAPRLAAPRVSSRRPWDPKIIQRREPEPV